MCHYCGCQQMPLIRDYIAEHDRSLSLAGDAVRALDRDDVAGARDLVGALRVELRSHWQGEEEGIFAVMRVEPDYADYIAPLEQEHRELDAFLAAVDLDDAAERHRFRAAVDELREHILKEEDGLFPASLIALSGSDWDAAMSAWTKAHPGREMIRD